jgi:SAM-dependent methyltransferase
MRRDLSRSVRLFRSFRAEQTDPDRFYGDLAADSLAEVREHLDPDGAIVLDVGAGPRQFATAFLDAGARYVPVDQDPAVSSMVHDGVVATGARLPFADGAADLVFCSNVLEHVPDPAALADELFRVVRPGGLLYLSYTNWLSPWGGHETSPYHWTGGRRAARRYARRHGHPPKNLIDRTLFRVSVADGLRWASGRADADVLVARPRYLPDASRHLLRLPLVREFVTWNLLLVLRKR